MTSGTTPYGNVISSGYLDTRYDWLAFDGTDSQVGESNSWGDGTNTLDGTTEACYIGYEFTQNVYVTDISISFMSKTRTYTGCFQCRVNGQWVTTINDIAIAKNYSKLDITQKRTKCDAVRFCVLTGSYSKFTTASTGGNVCELVVNGFI